MKKNQMISITTFITSLVTSLSLVASVTSPQNNLRTHTDAHDLLWNDDDLLSDSPEGINSDSTLLSADLSPAEEEQMQEDLAPPFSEGDSNIDEPPLQTVQPDLKPDLNKVLYDPKMNYGTGSPVPKPTPITTTKRNLIVLGTSTILATVAMLVVATNKGADAPRGH